MTQEQATERQIEYRNKLVKNTVGKVIYFLDDAALINAIAAVKLPEPASKADASAQIDALKGSIESYDAEWFAQVTAMTPERTEELKAIVLDQIRSSRFPVNEITEILRAA